MISCRHQCPQTEPQGYLGRVKTRKNKEQGRTRENKEQQRTRDNKREARRGLVLKLDSLTS